MKLFLTKCVFFFEIWVRSTIQHSLSSALLSAHENFFLKKHHKREAIDHITFRLSFMHLQPLRYLCARVAVPSLSLRSGNGVVSVW